jgi:hypothetical protein
VDCKTFRRRLLIDPGDAGPEFRDHARDCPACAHAAESARAFEVKLRHALDEETGRRRSAVPVRRRRHRLSLRALLRRLIDRPRRASRPR